MPGGTTLDGLGARFTGNARVEAHEAKNPHDHKARKERPPVHVQERNAGGGAVCHRHEQRAGMSLAVIRERETEREQDEKRGQQVN